MVSEARGRGVQPGGGGQSGGEAPSSLLGSLVGVRLESLLDHFLIVESGEVVGLTILVVLGLLVGALLGHLVVAFMALEPRRPPAPPLRPLGQLVQLEAMIRYYNVAGG